MSNTTVVVFPFDLFGGGGSGAGASLVADELREVLADNRRETVATRARAYTSRVRLREVAFETLDSYQGWRRHGRKVARQVLGRGDFLVWLAGNHLGVLPVYEELGTHADVAVVQLDAHLDIHNFADVSSELSHGNFLRHARGPLPPLTNVGHRELLLRDEAVREYFREAISARILAVDPAGALGRLREAVRPAARVWLDIDWDVLDAAYFPATGRAVPFGLTPAQLLQVVEAVGLSRLMGVSLSEFDPARDAGDRSLALVLWWLEDLLIRRYEGAE